MRGVRFLAAVAAAVSFVVAAPSARAQEAAVEVGFVASVGDGTVLVSNVPVGAPGGETMVLRRKDRPPRPPAGAAAPAASGEAKGGGAPGTFTFKKADGKEAAAGESGEAKGGGAPGTFTFKKADGKEPAAAASGEAAGEGKGVTLSRADIEKMKSKRAQADPEAKPAPRTEGADEKVTFHEFQVTADTHRPAELAPGAKVKVTYVVEGERKVALKIEIVQD